MPRFCRRRGFFPPGFSGGFFYGRGCDDSPKRDSAMTKQNDSLATMVVFVCVLVLAALVVAGACSEVADAEVTTLDRSRAASYIDADLVDAEIERLGGMGAHFDQFEGAWIIVYENWNELGRVGLSE